MLFREDKLARLDAETIRKSVGWYRWTHDLVEVTGADALEILEKIYVSNIGKVLPGKTKYTAMLDEKGVIIDDVIVMHMSEGVYWVSTLYGPRLIPWIEAHAEGKDVQTRLITYDWDMYAVQGPESPAALEKLLDTPLEGMKRFLVAASAIGGIPVYVHRSGFTGENGFEIYCAAEKTGEIRNRIAAAVEASGGREIYTLEVYVRSIPMEKGFGSMVSPVSRSILNVSLALCPMASTSSSHRRSYFPSGPSTFTPVTFPSLISIPESLEENLTSPPRASISCLIFTTISWSLSVPIWGFES